MPGVGVSATSALGVENGIETGYEHVVWDVSGQRVVDPSQYIPRRVRGLGNGTEHAAGAGHNQGRRHTVSCGVSHDDAPASLRKLEEVVEVSPNLPSGSVVWGDLPTLKLGHFLGERGLLDVSSYPELLLDT